MPRRPVDAEILRDFPRDTGSIEFGTVGWEDGEQHYDLGTAENDGNTLVKVTLFRGRDPSKRERKDLTRCKGHKILARLSAPLWFIPSDGAQVIVAIPAGLRMTPGAPVIIAVPGANPTQQFGTGEAQDAMLDFGPDRRVIIKGKTVVLCDYEDRYWAVGPQTGIKGGDADANGCQLKGGGWKFYAGASGAGTEAKSLLVLDANEAYIGNKGSANPSGMRAKNGDFTAFGLNGSIATGFVRLGINATATTFGAYVAVPPGAAPVPSTTVWMQP